MRALVILFGYLASTVKGKCGFTDEWEFQSQKYRNISDLGKAAAEDDVKAIEKSIADGCSHNYNKTQFYYTHWQWKSGYTPLHIASTHGANEAVRKIISIEDLIFDDLDVRDEFGATAVYAAAYWRYSITVSILDKAGANISIPNNNGATPLYVAAQNGHLHTVKTLVKLGTNIDQGLDDGATPLITASSKNQVDVVQYLVEKCADINAKGGTTTHNIKTNRTALDWAQSLGHHGVIKILRDRQDNTDVCKKKEVKKYTTTSPIANCPITSEWEFQGHKYKKISELGKAAALNDAPAMDDSIENGCDVSYNKTQFYYRHWGWRTGFTPLHIASTHGANEAIKKLLDYEDFFHDFINARDDLGATAAYAAAYWEYSASVTILEEAGADISIPNIRGATPLYVAAQNGHLHTVQGLIGLGADIDQGKDSGATPLYIAAEQGHVEIVYYLVNLGANLTKHSKTTQKTPVIAARTQGHLDIVQILEEAASKQQGVVSYDQPSDTRTSKEGLIEKKVEKHSAMIVSVTLLVIILLFGVLYMLYRVYKKKIMDDDKVELL